MTTLKHKSAPAQAAPVERSQTQQQQQQHSSNGLGKSASVGQPGEIEISHESHLLSSKSSSGATHKWTISVTGRFNDHVIDDMISHATFRLHESFPNPIRKVTTPPFSLSESGWGSFTLKVEVLLKNKQKFTLPYDLLLNSWDEPSLRSKKSYKVNFKNLTTGTASQQKAPAAADSPPAIEKTPRVHHARREEKSAAAAKKHLDLAAAEKKKEHDQQQVPGNKKLKVSSDGPPNSAAADLTELFGSPLSKSKPQKPSSKATNTTSSPQAAAGETNTTSSDNSNTFLEKLRSKIEITSDPSTLWSIVTCVRESGYLQKSDESYDFDLCELDCQTLSRIQKILKI